MIWDGCALEGQSGHEGAWALLARLYRQQTGEALPEIRRTDRGKPCFVSSPWHFSLTHTKHHAFCVLSRCPVGIDAEELDRRADLRLADRVLSPGEKAQFDRAEDKKKALLTFWVLKEAQVKCTGEGLQGYPNQTDFSLEDPRVRLREGCLVAIIEEKD